MAREREVRRWWSMVLVWALAWGCAEANLPAEGGNGGDMSAGGVTTRPTPTSNAVDGSRIGQPCVLLSSQDCGEGLKCVADASGAPICVRRRADEADLEASCDGPDSCVPGAACVAWSDTRGTRCTELCDPEAAEQGEGCRFGWTCSAALSTNAQAGLCERVPVACDIFAQNCSATLDCVVMYSEIERRLGTFCGYAGEGSVGSPCSGGLSACERGLICVRAESGSEPTCQPLCREDPVVGCPGGLSCTGFAESSGLAFCR